MPLSSARHTAYFPVKLQQEPKHKLQAEGYNKQDGYSSWIPVHNIKEQADVRQRSSAQAYPILLGFSITYHFAWSNFCHTQKLNDDQKESLPQQWKATPCTVTCFSTSKEVKRLVFTDLFVTSSV